jgi:hypothetical protein
MVGVSIARNTRPGTFVGPRICKKCLPVWTFTTVEFAFKKMLQIPFGPIIASRFMRDSRPTPKEWQIPREMEGYCCPFLEIMNAFFSPYVTIEFISDRAEAANRPYLIAPCRTKRGHLTHAQSSQAKEG